MKEKIKKIIKKNLLFILPLVLLILYFLYPIPVTTFKSVSQTISEKKVIDEIVIAYENQRTLYQGVSPKEAKKQWEEKCIKSCLETEPDSPTGSFSPEEICKLRCFSRLTMGEGEVYFKYGAERIEELKNSSYAGLFFKNFDENIIFAYRKLIKNFHFENIIVMLLSLVLYYVVIFSITFIKRLEKRT